MIGLVHVEIAAEPNGVVARGAVHVSRWITLTSCVVGNIKRMCARAKPLTAERFESYYVRYHTFSPPPEYGVVLNE